MTQGTTVSGPGMAGRGVPGQVFSWGQYGSAQPFGAGEAPRLAFAGPPSINDGGEMQPEESRAMFHSTNRPPKRYGVGHVYRSGSCAPSSYHGHSGAVTPIMEGQRRWSRKRKLCTVSTPGFHVASDGCQAAHALRSTAAPPSSQFQQNPHARYSLGGAAPADYRSTDSPVDGRSPFSEQVPSRGPGTPEIGTTRYVRPEPIHQSMPSQMQAIPAAPRGSASETNGGMTSAEAEKQQLYERARQQAERNQRRADERRALHQGVAGSASITAALAAMVIDPTARPTSLRPLPFHQPHPPPQQQQQQQQ